MNPRRRVTDVRREAWEITRLSCGHSLRHRCNPFADVRHRDPNPRMMGCPKCAKKRRHTPIVPDRRSWRRRLMFAQPRFSITRFSCGHARRKKIGPFANAGRAHVAHPCPNCRGRRKRQKSKRGL